MFSKFRLLAPNISGKGQVKFSLVLPTYNESENIAQIVVILAQLLDDTLLGEYEWIVVDDNSLDKTWQLAKSLLPTYPQLKVMRRIQEKGLSTAVIRGWQAAEGEILGVIDADLQHPQKCYYSSGRKWNGERI